ncbi:MAG: MlaD family protein [Fibrobacter sp.]|nr:MlaD family protein [Fibrobacter sp.]
MSDKTLGYIVLAILMLFLLIPASYFVRKTDRSDQLRTIEFENIKTMDFLSIQDPVRINGVNVGIVKKIDTKNNKTLVLVATNHPLTLFKDYQITSTIKGLLGERYLDIYPGNPQLGQIAPTDTLKGFFIPALSDVIPNMHKLDSMITFVIQTTNKLRYGSPGTVSFVDQFNDIVSKLDTLTNDINVFSGKLNLNAVKSLDSLNGLFNEVSSQADIVASSLPGLINNCNNIVVKADLLVAQLDTLVTRANSAVVSINSADTTSLKKYVEGIQVRLEKLRGALDIMRSDKLRLPVHF